MENNYLKEYKELEAKIYGSFENMLTVNEPIDMSYVDTEEGLLTSNEWYTIYDSFSGNPLKVTVLKVEKKDNNQIFLHVIEEHRMDIKKSYWIGLEELFDLLSKINLLSDLKEELKKTL